MRPQMSMGAFEAHSHPLSQARRQAMRGVSWREDPRCPAFESLRLLRVRHHDFEGGVRDGELVVSSSVVDDLCAIFAELFEVGFAIERMQPIEAFDGNDDASMAANNSSAFNFRTIGDSDVLSHHALGVAVDLNPRINPMFVGDVMHPQNGLRERAADGPGVITRPGPVVAAFERRGWHWGGEWPDLRDLHHFSARARGT